MPVVLVGTQVGGRANFMAVGWCSRANARPPMIVCAIGKGDRGWKAGLCKDRPTPADYAR